MNNGQKLVIIPTYNEKENVIRMIDTVMALDPGYHILIVDDNSPDGTAGLVKEAIERFPGRLHILERNGKAGLGTAYIAGFKWALDRDYEYIFEMDCDFSHNPKDLNRLLAVCTNSGADLAIGSRYVKGGKVQNWPVARIMMSYFASVYVRLVLWMNIKDTTAGFKCYRRRVLEAIELDKIRFVGYAFQIEMKYTTWRLGFRITEVPITFVDRIEGISKMSTSIFKEAFGGVVKMRFQKK